MKIFGLQKVSVIDYPGEIACIIFLHGCNFRCGFCHNPSLVITDGGDGFSEEYVLDFLKVRIGKLDAVCITGGEPLMTLKFDFVRKIKEMGYKIKIDTNGSFPNRLKEMIDLGLVDYIAMDIKGPKGDYSKIAGVDVNVDKIEKSIKIVHDFCHDSNKSEFRTTIVGRLHNVHSIILMAKWLNLVCKAKPKKFFLQGFKAKGDLVDSSFSKEKDVSEMYLSELKGHIDIFFGEVKIRV